MAQPNWFRRCVGCGEARHKKELLRIVKFPDNHLELDPDQNKPGRGAYICPKIDCAKQAKINRGFNRSFRMEVEPAFYERLIKEVDK